MRNGPQIEIVHVPGVVGMTRDQQPPFSDLGDLHVGAGNFSCARERLVDGEIGLVALDELARRR